MKISYNYEDLLAEIESDIKEGLLDPEGNILVLRENITVKACLAEMREMNRVL